MCSLVSALCLRVHMSILEHNKDKIKPSTPGDVIALETGFRYG